MKRIVVFGANGGVGAYFVKYAYENLDKSKYELILVGRRNTDFWKKKGIRYHIVDITNSTDFDRLPKEDIYAIVHLAAQIPTHMEEYDSWKYVNTNIVGTYNILEYCRKVNADRVLYTTTISDSSAENEKNLKETYPHKFLYGGSNAMYAISKNCGVEMVKHYEQEYGLKGFIFRLPTVYFYSKNQYWINNGEKKKRPLYQFIEKAKKGEPIEIWGDKDAKKEMVYVYDVAQLICNAIETNKCDGGFFNAGNGMPITLEEEVRTIIEVFTSKDNISQLVFRPEKDSKNEYIMEINNAINLLAYSPAFNCKKLLEDMKKEIDKYTFEDLYR